MWHVLETDLNVAGTEPKLQSIQQSVQGSDTNIMGLKWNPQCPAEYEGY
jgi:hypothetical protein